MNTQQIQFLRNWEKRKKVKSSPSVALSTLTDRLFLNSHFVKETFHDYVVKVHPILFYYFLGDWEKSRDGVNSQFWRNINREWLELCWKQKFWSTSGLHIYKNIDELKAELDRMFGNGQAFGGGYEDALQHLIDVQQERLDKKEAELEAERQRAEEAKRLAELQQRERAAREEADKLRRLQKQQEAEELAARNRAISAGANSPWSSSVGPGKEIKHENKPAVNALADFMDEPINFMDEAEPEFLIPKYTHPGANEVLLLKKLGTDSEYNLIEFGVSLTKTVLDSKFKNMRFTKDPKTGDLILYFSEKPGISYAGTKLENNQVYLQFFCKEALEYIQGMYNGATKLDLSENISQVGNVVAFKIESCE